MRTQDEIVARIRDRRKHDLLGFEVSEYIDYLDYAHAKEYLKGDTTEERWEKVRKETKTPEETIKDYMPFAWDKANNCRGISAGRSIQHMVAWLWLDGKEWAEEIEDCEYYGKHQLVRICREYGIEWRDLDDNRWTNEEGEKGISADEALKAAA